MRKLLPSRATTISLLALFVALGGSAYAASYVITSKSQIAPKVRRELRGNTGSAGAPGARGPSGVVGIPLSGPFVGPLPTAATQFTKHDNNSDLLVTISGTGFRTTVQGPGIGRFALWIDGVERGDTALYFNDTLVHETLPTAQIVVTGLSAGTHTLTLQSDSNTITTDGTDFYRVTMLEVTPGS